MKRNLILYSLIIFVFSFAINVSYSYIRFVSTDVGFMNLLVKANNISFWYITPILIVLLQLFFNNIQRKMRYLVALIALLIVEYIDMWLNNYYFYTFDKIDNIFSLMILPSLQVTVVILYDIIFSVILKLIKKVKRTHD